MVHMISYLINMILRDAYGILNIACDYFSDPYVFIIDSYDVIRDAYEFLNDQMTS